MPEYVHIYDYTVSIMKLDCPLYTACRPVQVLLFKLFKPLRVASYVAYTI